MNSAAFGAINKWEQAEQDAKECVRLNPGFKKGKSYMQEGNAHQIDNA